MDFQTVARRPISRRLAGLAAFLTALAGFLPPEKPLAAEEISRWDFDSTDLAWKSNDQATLTLEEGSLRVVSTGDDPQLAASVAGRAGQHQLAVTAKFTGRADFQVFWTTEKHPDPDEERSVRGLFAGLGQNPRTIRLWFPADEPITSLRIDPFSRAGEMLIEEIVLTDDAAPVPQATPVADIRVPQGFQVELLHAVSGDEMGSWVSMTPDPKGRLIVSDQYGMLYRITPPAIGSADSVRIEPVPIDLGMAQGLLYAFDSLYVMVNGIDSEKQGLYRVRDTDNDDQFDSVEWLRQIDGGGEHGPHAVILAPDGQSLYVCAGNHTNLTQFSSSRLPQNWDEDQLLPRMWDAGGHAVGRMAPGGWIAKVSPDGKDWELVAGGFRNQYDIAFSPEGELFTYDADMEWDVGSPWYRPTRVNHVTSGSEFGWRSGTGKWPVWYPDSLGAVVNIGPGSPTGIAFGTGSRFPAKYQRALLIADWSYGVIYAVHLSPDGATYTGEAERFVSAAPLPVTDIVVNPHDQALYFTIGGRRTQSGLYRVTYQGSESTETPPRTGERGSDSRALRRSLESLHVATAPNESSLNTAWKFLGHPDRTVRYAARIAVEHQPVSSWQERALSDQVNSDARITALLALVRCGDKSVQPRVLESLSKLDGSALSEEQQLAALRVLALCFIRMGPPDAQMAKNVAAVLNPSYPSGSSALNRELCALLVYLNDDQVAAKTLALMAGAATQEEQIHYVMCLRVLKPELWTMDQRRQYFQWFLTAGGFRGGHSFAGFLKNFRKEAIETLPASDRVPLKDLIEAEPVPAEAVVEVASRPVVREWKVDDLLKDVEAGLVGRSFDNGRKMFAVTACFKCHRFAGDGGIVGPELTAVGRRYNARTMLESLIEPSRVISDQYEARVFVLKNGTQVTGRVVNLNGNSLLVSENMLDPGKLTAVDRDEIEQSSVSRTSLMPAGLLNTLTKDDILDLVAYLQSGGDPDAAAFKGRKVSARTSAIERRGE